MTYWLVRWAMDSSVVFLGKTTQRSNAKIQRHFRFSPPRTWYEFGEKTCETFEEKCYKYSTGREIYKLGVSGNVH